jgi:hypothetical protein
MKKLIIITIAAITLLSSCTVRRGLPCPCMHCSTTKATNMAEKGVRP